MPRKKQHTVPDCVYTPHDALRSRGARFDVDYFFTLVGGRRRNRSAILGLQSLKAIYSMLIRETPGLLRPARMLRAGRYYRYQRSLPKPNFSPEVAFSDVYGEEYILDAKKDHMWRNHGILMKKICGVSVPPLLAIKGSILAKCARIYPLELSNLLYKFAVAHMDNMCIKELRQMEQMLSVDPKDSYKMLYGYLSAQLPVESELIASNGILPKLCSYVWKCHPGLANCGTMPPGLRSLGTHTAWQLTPGTGSPG